MNRIEIIKLMEEKERERDFHYHVVPHNTNFKPLTPNYDYYRRSFGKKFSTAITGSIFKLGSHIFAAHYKLKIIGKENLKLIKDTGALVTTNHIHHIDCALIRYITRSRKLKITMGEFNNFRGVGGNIIRSAVAMPMSSNPICTKNFHRAIGYYLQHKYLISFCPEGSLWYCYEKPRPLLSGAYHFAVKYNVPVLPMFFTFKDIKKRKDGTYRKKIIVHIGKPIYPENNLTPKENIEYLKNENEKFNKEIYESFYNKKLEYLD